MTTLRRLLVAVYPIRLFLLTLAVWGVAANVRAQSPVNVGYYDIAAGAGIPQQVPPIVAAGFTPVPLSDVAAADLVDLQILFVHNPNAMGYSAAYLAAVPEIRAAVEAGLVLVVHDRSVGPHPIMGTRRILPLPTGVPFPVFARVPSNNNSVSDAATLVANGPGGIVTELNLDNGNFSNMGFAMFSTFTAPGKKGLLHTGTANNAVTFSYPLGLGYVIYSSIPLDMFLKDMGTASPAVRDAFKNIYAPNVLAYAGCGLKPLPATVSATAATGHYGGTATLSATVRCGVIPVSGITVDFSINGTPVGSAQTDESGVATLANASLGASPDSAIPVGTYATGVSAAFAGTAQYGAGSGTAALTVEKAPATITYEGGEFVYAGSPHAATGSVTGVFGESLGAPSFTYTDQNGVTTDAAPVNAGVYGIAASSNETENYLGTTVSSSETTISVTPAPLSIRADDASKIYGAALPGFTASYEGFVRGQGPGVLGGSLAFATPAKVDSVVGQYSLTPSGLSSGNYSITFVDGKVRVTPAPLKIRAEDKERLVGKPNPPLTVSYEGLVLDDTGAGLDVAPSLTTTALLTSPEGLYPIVVGGASDANYTIEHVNGQFTVSPEGRIHGSGFLDHDGARHHFGFDARETIVSGEKGSLTLRVDRDTEPDDVFVSQVVTSVVFKNNPSVSPGGNAAVDAVTLTGLGMWNGVVATFELTALDKGEPGVGNDTVNLRIKVGGKLVHTTSGPINGGNVQSNRVK